MQDSGFLSSTNIYSIGWLAPMNIMANVIFIKMKVLNCIVGKIRTRMKRKSHGLPHALIIISAKYIFLARTNAFES